MQNEDFIRLKDEVESFLPGTGIAFQIVLAVTASAWYQNSTMLWVLLVGVPSSGKTDLVRLVKTHESSYYLDNLTQNAFISGERSTEQHKVFDLLPRLNGKCLVIKDWTAIFSLQVKMTKKLLGDLVGIYDQEFAKFSSRRGNVRYESSFSQLGCITPATLNKHTGYMNMVGPRFLFYTMPSLSSEKENLVFRNIFSQIDRSKKEKRVRKLVKKYLDSLSNQEFNIEPFSSGVREFLKQSARLIASCRGVVIIQAVSMKNEEGRSATFYEVQDIQIEQPWRSVQQISLLARFLAFVAGKSCVSSEELKIIKDVVLSSMPADRAKAIKSLIRLDGKVTAKQLAQDMERSTKTARRLLDEFTALGVLIKKKKSKRVANNYLINKQFRNLILQDPVTFLSHSKTAGEMTEQEIMQCLNPTESNRSSTPLL